LGHTKESKEKMSKSKIEEKNLCLEKNQQIRKNDKYE